MSGSRRLFVGLPLPRAAAEDLRRAVQKALAPLLARGLRLAPAGEIHLTLHFLGATDEDRIADLTAALGRRLAGARAPRLRIDRTGGFPEADRARVLWAGVREEAGAEGRLRTLEQAARGAVRDTGLPAVEEGEADGHPHLTVARPRGRERLSLPAAFRELSLDLPWTPAAVVLFESRPGEQGEARYPALATFVLSPDSA